MGCDIHLVLERKDKERDRWVGVRSYRYFAASLLYRVKITSNYAGYVLKQRDYSLFNDLCGVRGDGSEFGYEPKGLPDDMSDLTAMELSDDSDLHSHSWLSMAELRPVMEKHFGPQLVAGRLKDEVRAGADVLRTFVDDDIGDEYAPEENWRLVFAFDN